MPDLLDMRKVLAGVVAPVFKARRWITIEAKTLHGRDGGLRTIILAGVVDRRSVFIVTHKVERPFVVQCTNLLVFGDSVAVDLQSPNSVENLTAWLVAQAESHRPAHQLTKS